MILIVGGEGNMGRRYGAILDHLGVEYSKYDRGNIFERSSLNEHAYDADAFIIATPTETHSEIIVRLAAYRKPILCEKPICKDPTEFAETLKFALENEVNLQMVNQYAFMPGALGGVGRTVYDYFKSGGDGIYWDCINIRGLAKGELYLANTSPVWTCEINGTRLDIGDMDHAYVNMIKAWLDKPKPNLDYIEHAHYKVLEAIS